MDNYILVAPWQMREQDFEEIARTAREYINDSAEAIGISTQRALPDGYIRAVLWALNKQVNWRTQQILATFFMYGE